MTWTVGDVSGSPILTDDDHLYPGHINELRKGATNLFNAASYGTGNTGTEIQAAIDAAEAAGGGVVYIPAGTWTVSPVWPAHGITIAGDNITLLGDGAGKTIIKLADGYVAASGIPSVLSMETTQSNITLQGITFDGNQDNCVLGTFPVGFTQQGTGGIVIKLGKRTSTFGTITNLKMIDVEVKEGLSFGMIFMGSGRNLWIDKCNFHDNGYDYGSVIATYGSGLHLQYDIHDILISNTVFKDNWRDGLFMYDLNPAGSTPYLPSLRVQVVNCLFEGNSIGFDFENSNGAVPQGSDWSGLKVIGCNFKDNNRLAYNYGYASPALNISGVGAVVQGDFFTGNHGGANIGQIGSGKVVVNGCVFSENNASPTQNTRGQAIQLSPNVAGTITNCVFYGHALNAVHLRGPTGDQVGVIISNNRFELNGGHGIYGYRHAGKVTVTGNIFLNNGQLLTDTYADLHFDDAGSLPYSVNSNINGNTFLALETAKTKYGIWIKSSVNSTGNLIQNNFFSGHTTIGILHSGTTDTVRNNIGFTTEAKGTGTIASGATTAVITHGLSVTPTLKDITVTLGELSTTDPGQIYITAIGATTFTVNCRTNPGVSGLDFAWQAIVL
jgi:hypothetical protein